MPSLVAVTGVAESLPAPRQRRSIPRRRILGLTLIQAALALVVYLRGFPYFGTHLVSNAPLWEAPVSLFHLPGILALSIAGLCCGFGHGLVLGPRVVAGHVPVSVPGTLILAATNWLVWTAMLVIVVRLWRFAARTRRPAEPRVVASSETSDS